MTEGVFLIGTDRDVGKTMVGAGLVALLRARGREAVLMTPVSTGGEVESADDLLKEIGIQDVERRLVNPIHLLKNMNLPSIIVARSSRRTINHSLLTTRVMAAAGLTPLGFILNGYGRFGEGFAESLNADTLGELAPEIPVLATLEWRPSYRENFQLFVRELGRQQALNTLPETWT